MNVEEQIKGVATTKFNDPQITSLKLKNSESE